ncbi:MAG: 16S rRNA (cytosine(1402)-N(4))-methyltransferase RsmH [Campylobacterota bacterium]|nr:16S rRNA (cytosine(1402)-N(4))-methyltransferase RsmH [Campylobacterota bacterium]
MTNTPHIPVLYNEVIDSFASVERGIIIDCTLGYGGHTSLLLDTYPHLHVIGIDQDETAIEFSTARLAEYGDRVRIKKGRFSDVIKEILQEHNSDEIVGVLADIGVSSLQLDDESRGFSYDSNVLDMRMNKESSFDAKSVVNEYSQKDLENILYNYGELKNSRSLASAIISKRPFDSSKMLSEVVKPFAPRGKKIHPATLVFQAIRIEVNDELGELNRLLDALKENCLSRAKVGIISFHSLEDRVVKQKFTLWSKKCICDIDVMRCECGNNNDIGKIVTKKPLCATSDELKQNPRSRSAKLRVFQMSRSCSG